MKFDPNNVELKINGVAVDLSENTTKQYRICFNDNQSGIAEFKIAKQLCDQSSDKSVTIGVHKFPIIEFDNDNNCIVIDDTFNSFVGDSNLQE